MAWAHIFVETMFVKVAPVECRRGTTFRAFLQYHICKYQATGYAPASATDLWPKLNYTNAATQGGDACDHECDAAGPTEY